jgi:hypothetical protein
MAAPNISATTRHIYKGITRVLWVADIANVNAPTRAELNAGTDVANEIRENDGFLLESGSVETPDLGRLFTGSIPGSTTAEDSSLTLYADLGGTDARELMPRGTNGFIVWMDGGDVAGRPMDVFPVRVGSVGKNRTVDDDPATLTFNYNITSEPAEDVAIPA